LAQPVSAEMIRTAASGRMEGNSDFMVTAPIQKLDGLVGCKRLQTASDSQLMLWGWMTHPIDPGQIVPERHGNTRHLPFAFK
jgi:hypothetical protein